MVRPSSRCRLPVHSSTLAGTSWTRRPTVQRISGGFSKARTIQDFGGKPTTIDYLLLTIDYFFRVIREIRGPGKWLLMIDYFSECSLFSVARRIYGLRK